MMRGIAPRGFSSPSSTRNHLAVSALEFPVPVVAQDCRRRHLKGYIAPRRRRPYYLIASGICACWITHHRPWLIDPVRRHLFKHKTNPRRAALNLQMWCDADPICYSGAPYMVRHCRRLGGLAPPPPSREFFIRPDLLPGVSLPSYTCRFIKQDDEAWMIYSAAFVIALMLPQPGSSWLNSPTTTTTTYHHQKEKRLDIQKTGRVASSPSANYKVCSPSRRRRLLEMMMCSSRVSFELNFSAIICCCQMLRYWYNKPAAAAATDDVFCRHCNWTEGVVEIATAELK